MPIFLFNRCDQIVSKIDALIYTSGLWENISLVFANGVITDLKNFADLPTEKEHPVLLKFTSSWFLVCLAIISCLFGHWFCSLGYPCVFFFGKKFQILMWSHLWIPSFMNFAFLVSFLGMPPLVYKYLFVCFLLLWSLCLFLAQSTVWISASSIRAGRWAGMLNSCPGSNSECFQWGPASGQTQEWASLAA